VRIAVGEFESESAGPAGVEQFAGSVWGLREIWNGQDVRS
jgi:hypothetical protein